MVFATKISLVLDIGLILTSIGMVVCRLHNDQSYAFLPLPLVSPVPSLGEKPRYLSVRYAHDCARERGH